MEDQNEQMQFRFESESEPTPAQQRPQDGDRFEIPDKKTRKRIFLLLAAVALVAAIGGSALTAAIRAISAQNAARQETLSEQPASETEQETPDESENNAQTDEEKPFSVVKNPLPEQLPSNAGDKTLTPAEVYARSADSVVIVDAPQMVAANGEEVDVGSIGSGFILTQDGYILTSAHLVLTTDGPIVTLRNGEEYPAQIVGADEISDIALLKIEAEGLTAVSVAEEGSLAVGDEIVALGYPLGEFEFSLSHGYVSGLDREIEVETGLLHVFQMDVPINSGNSGGPVLDMNGNVIGIAAAKYFGESNSGVTIENIGFAVPIEDALEIAYDLQQYGHVQGRAYLGVTVRDVHAVLAEEYGLPVGPRVESVSPGSCAEKAGIQEGDILLSIDGTPIESTNELLVALRALHAGDRVKVELFRAGAELEVTVTLDERPGEDEIEAFEAASNSWDDYSDEETDGEFFGDFG